MMIVPIKRILLEGNLIVFKGNPKHEIPESKAFYHHFKNLATQKNMKYNEYSSDIHASKVQPIGPNDVVIGFSRGGFYADKLKNGFGAQGKFINIGAKDYPGADHYINHPSDNTASGNLGSKSLKSHWTLTNKIKKNLLNIIGVDRWYIKSIKIYY